LSEERQLLVDAILRGVGCVLLKERALVGKVCFWSCEILIAERNVSANEVLLEEDERRSRSRRRRGKRKRILTV